MSAPVGMDAETFAPDAPDAPLADLTALALAVADLYADRFGAPRDARFALMKLAEETGELTGAWLALQGESRRAGARDQLAAECADVLGFLLVLAAREGIDPAAALRRKWGAHLGPATT